uniref:PID domain-containing protein n=1 Tax=Arion vulgaris TaxID=1028688 RepID=A0A0B7AJU2_9EUPU
MPKKGNKQWQHPPEALLGGHILYTVKFLGECNVDHPKGTEVVKDAIRKMKFNKHIKRAEGQKSPKVELIISADAVTVLNPKTRLILYQYPLHQISYCADDKSDKRMFTFIAKEANGNRHFCYVFDSEKCAEEITLTIGQAFDLAYKRFLETSAPDGDIRKQFATLQKRVQALQFENDSLRNRLTELEKIKDRSDVDEYKRNNKITDLQNVTLNPSESTTDDDSPCSPSGTRIPRQSSVVGRRLENLVMSDDKTRKPARQSNGTHTTGLPGPAGSPPILSPPPASSRSSRTNNSRTANSGATTPGTPNSNADAFFGNLPQTTPSSIDPFGMEAFNPISASSDQELIDIQAGFSRGLSFGTDDFNIDDLDPLNQK